MTDSLHNNVATYPVGILAGTALVNADLAIPDDARGVVLFAHGSGSSRFSRRNRAVAAALQAAGFATILVDLLTPREEAEDVQTGRHRFDIELLASRVAAAAEWLAHDSRTRTLPIGYFGASTGAAAALVAAARRQGACRRSSRVAVAPISPVRYLGRCVRRPCSSLAATIPRFCSSIVSRSAISAARAR